MNKIALDSAETESKIIMKGPLKVSRKKCFSI